MNGTKVGSLCSLCGRELKPRECICVINNHYVLDQECWSTVKMMTDKTLVQVVKMLADLEAKAVKQAKAKVPKTRR